jgi:thiol-disulfide isomerase/thioredoxin
MNNHAPVIAASMLVVTGAALLPVQTREAAAQSMPAEGIALRREGDLPSLTGATGWLNSPPLTRADLHGRVVLIEFWTFSCVNWRRTLPYVRAWYEKYRDHGLVVIGVHTPEFEFEKDIDNVRTATNDLRVNYPVAIDSGAAIWRAFGNAYWPALYIVDAQGHIRHHKFGEGDYEQSERVVQRLLAEAGFKGVPRDLVAVEARGAEAAADELSLGSPETYVGYERGERFASPGGPTRNRRHLYEEPGRLGLNQWALSGDWSIGKQAAVLNSAEGRIAYRFHARDVNLIMGPPTRGGSVHFRVLIDGRSPGDAHGADVDAQGNGTVREPRMYQLIRQPAPIGDRDLQIEFLDPGVAAYDFTFG